MECNVKAELSNYYYLCYRIASSLPFPMAMFSHKKKGGMFVNLSKGKIERKIV